MSNTVNADKKTRPLQIVGFAAAAFILIFMHFLPVTETIENAIRAQIREAQAEAAELSARDEALIRKVQEMSKTIERLTAELGAKPTVDELANALKIPQSQVMETLKLMGEDLPEDRPEDPWETNPDLQRFLPR